VHARLLTMLVVGRSVPDNKPGPVLAGGMDVLTCAFTLSHLTSSLGVLLESKAAINL